MSIAISFEKFKEDILSKIDTRDFTGSGFYAVHCPVCGKEGKKTGGFRLEDDTIIYNCFRGKCDGSTVYKLGEPLSKKFKSLMDLYSVKIPTDIRMIRKTRQVEEHLDERYYKKNFYKDVTAPEGMVAFNKAPAHFREYWENEFEKRKTPLNDVTIIKSGKYRGCCAIEMKYFDKTIGYQIHTLSGKYVMHCTGNTNPIYIPEHKIPNNPIILVEGTFDAKCFPNTVATLKSTITPEQAYHLRGKDVIMLPDKTGNHFIELFHDYGWKISLPEWDVKDLNEAVVKYGILVTAKKIMSGVETNKLKAKTKYKRWMQKYKEGK